MKIFLYFLVLCLCIANIFIISEFYSLRNRNEDIKKNITKELVKETDIFWYFAFALSIFYATFYLSRFISNTSNNFLKKKNTNS